MQWSESQNGDVTVLRLEGEIDVRTSPGLRTFLQEKSAAQCPFLIVDLSAVNYLDSSGLATLVEYWRDCQDFGGKLGVAGVNERLQTIFEVSRMEEILSIHPAVEDAIAALKS